MVAGPACQSTGVADRDATSARKRRRRGGPFMASVGINPTEYFVHDPAVCPKPNVPAHPDERPSGEK